MLLHSLNRTDTAPPLPRKKRPNVPCSKQEKEVENLTEKNRCSVLEKEKEDVSPSNSLLSKPRIAKLKALFERSPTSRERNSKHRNSQTVSRSHSLGAIRKPLFDEAEKHKASGSQQPIPDGGKLKVPKLSLSPATVISRPVPLIKRSKSLKIVSQEIRIRKPKESPRPEVVKYGTFSRSKKPSPQAPPQDLSKRRRSLESLMGDEPPAITWPLDPKTKKESAAELLKHQFQSLTIEAHKKMNMLVSGIGVRERRNSFRQAISREEGRSNYEKIWIDPSNTVQVDGYPKNFNDKLTVRNQNGEILQPVVVDQVDGPRKRNVYERIDFVPNYPKPPVVQRSKTTRFPDSKNLFLHRLNIEIQEEREREKEKNAKPVTRPYGVRSEPEKETPLPNFLGVHAYKKTVKEIQAGYATSYDLYQKKMSNSSGELSHSDSDSPRVKEAVGKRWMSDGGKQDLGSESSSSSSAQELSCVMNCKPPEHVYNYGELLIQRK